MERRIANLACYVGRFLPWRTLSGALPYRPAQPHFPIVSPLRPLAPRCRRTSSHLYGVPLITIRRRPSHSSVALSPISSTDHATNMIFVLSCPILPPPYPHFAYSYIRTHGQKVLSSGDSLSPSPYKSIYPSSSLTLPTYTSCSPRAPVSFRSFPL